MFQKENKRDDFYKKELNLIIPEENGENIRPAENVITKNNKELRLLDTNQLAGNEILLFGEKNNSDTAADIEQADIIYDREFLLFVIISHILLIFYFLIFYTM